MQGAVHRSPESYYMPYYAIDVPNRFDASFWGTYIDTKPLVSAILVWKLHGVNTQICPIHQRTLTAAGFGT